MFKKTKFFVGIALLVQSFTCFIVFVTLAIKKKSLWKTFLTIALAGGFVGGYLTFTSLKHDRKFRKVLEAVDDLCDYDDDYEDDIPEVPVDDTASEAEFEN